MEEGEAWFLPGLDCVGLYLDALVANMQRDDKVKKAKGDLAAVVNVIQSAAKDAGN